MYNTKNVAITFALSLLTVAANAQLFGSDRKKSSSAQSRYEVKSQTRADNTLRRQQTSYDGFDQDTTQTESKASKTLSNLFKKSNTKSASDSKPASASKATSSAAKVSQNSNNKFEFKGFALNGIVNVESLKADTNPPAGFKKYITDMRFYEEGEDLRLVDNSGLNVTMMFEPGTSRIVSIQVENIDRMDQVQQLQQLVKKEMGVPARGYEVIRNYDGTGNSVWTDYSTYEFVYQYNYGNVVYDFHISQFGAKKVDGKILHPYDFLAKVTIPAEKEQSAAEQSLEAAQETSKSDAAASKTDDNFYPKEGVQRHGNYSVEVKLLSWW